MHYLEPRDLPPQLKHLHTGGLVKVLLTLQVTIPMDNGLWSSGTRTCYTAIELATGQAVSLTDESAPWSPGRKDRTFVLRPGYGVAQTGSFCGKNAGLTLMVHPDDAAPMLPAPTRLTPTEFAVLDTIAGFKSAYRIDEYRRRDLTGAAVEAAKASLHAAGLIDTRGAVTVKGRNARTDGKAQQLAGELVLNF